MTIRIVPRKKSNVLSPLSAGVGLPSHIGKLTLDELITMENVEVKKKDNHIKVKQITTTETISLDVRLYPDGYSVTGSAMSRPAKKKQLRDTVLKMLEEGKSQEEVAHILDMSQSYVSKIAKK